MSGAGLVLRGLLAIIFGDIELWMVNLLVNTIGLDLSVDGRCLQQQYPEVTWIGYK